MKTTRVLVKIGQTLNTPFGEGEVIGFEDWDEDDQLYIAEEQKGTERVYMKLYDGHTWPTKTGTFAFFHNELLTSNPDLPTEEITDES